MQTELKELIAQKDTMEKEIASLTTQIELIDQTKQFSHGLVDHEGFPRNDINFGKLANYRNLKRRKAELNNDHCALMKQIESKLFALHAAFKPSPEQQEWSKETSQPQNAFVKVEKREKNQEKQEKHEHKIDYLTPFARIGLAEEDSPAWRGGVREDDLLSEFGEINIYSLDWKKQIAGAVKEGKGVRLVVMRKVEGEKASEFPCFELKDKQSYQKMVLEVVPGRWKGRGLLGCQINPL